MCAALANGVVLTGLIALHRTNRTANLTLAALIFVVTARLGPYALGFAGLYDAHPWLTFLPLAFGPLLWAYVVAVSGGSVSYPTWHLAPAGLQLAYWIACFALPLASAASSTVPPRGSGRWR